VGLAAWLAYRPRLEQSAHHLIKPLALPWLVVALAMALAVVATFMAASRPARAMTHMPVVAALYGRPAPPKQVRRSALPGLAVLAGAFALLSFAGSQNHQGGALELVLGLVAPVVAVILLSPFCLALLGRASRHAPVTVRLPLRDLARYRARAGCPRLTPTGPSPPSHMSRHLCRRSIRSSHGAGWFVLVCVTERMECRKTITIGGPRAHALRPFQRNLAGLSGTGAGGLVRQRDHTGHLS
jgi:hypothetical protein